MIKKITFGLVVLCLSTQILAQNRDANWCFGDSLGVRFSDYLVFETLMVSDEYIDYPTEANASISDEDGQLLLYTNANTIWNENNQVVGDSIFGNYTVANGVLFLPSLVDTNEIVLISIGYTWNTLGLYATTANLTLNGGIGGIVPGLKNVMLTQDTLSERVLAVRHANGRDWWLIATHYWANARDVFLYSPSGIELMSVQHIGSQLDREGEICASMDGSMIAAVSMSGFVDVYDFDRCTGTLSNLRHLQSSSGNYSEGPYGCSLSPDGSQLYFSNLDTLFQVTISASSLSTPQIIWINPFPLSNTSDSIYALGQHELAPDGKNIHRIL